MPVAFGIDMLRVFAVEPSMGGACSVVSFILPTQTLLFSDKHIFEDGI